MESTTFLSKVLHFLGSLGGNSPSALAMPADFYLENGDRATDSEADVRSQEHLRRKIGTVTFGLSHIDGRGPRSSIYVTLICLLVTTVGVGIAGVGQKKWEAHVAKVHVQAQQDEADAQTKALADLGPVDQTHCASHLDDFNGLSADSSKWSSDDKAMGAFRNECLSAEVIGAGTGNPPQYQVRKFGKAAFASMNAKTCGDHLADINAMTAKAGWSTNMNPDAMALRTFALVCSNAGFIAANTSSPLADGAVFSVEKFNVADYMFAGATKCNAVLSDMNAVVSKPGWRNATNADARILATFSNACAINGFVKVKAGPNDTETLTSTGKQ